MDRSWIHQRRISEEYDRGVSEFILYVKEHAKPVNGAYFCPCVRCLNQVYEDLDNIRDHLFIYGIMRSYTVWTWNGEVLYKPTTLRGSDYVEEWTSDHLDEMLLKEMLRENNTLPIRNYGVKIILCPMGLEYQKIHACPNDCVLYRDQYASMKVVWYLPIVPRLKRLFSIKEDVRNLMWYIDGRKCDNLFRHPVDSPQWKNIDATFPEFSAEPRNIRLALATDGINPYGNLKGVEVFDSYSEENFRLRAMLFCTINDFLAYGNLVVIVLKLSSTEAWAENCVHKNRRFLPQNHPYRRLKKAFNGSPEDDVVCKPHNGEEVTTRGILTHLSLFFNAICKKVVDPRQLDDLHNEAIRLLCQLEIYFPPSVFDIMVHLIVHLVREIRICGPVFLRALPCKEAIEFCSSYMPSCEPIGLPKKTVHEHRREGKGVRGVRIESVGGKEVNQAHLYILDNTKDVIPYISQHIDEIKSAHPRISEKWTLNEHNKSFLAWFKKKIYVTPNVSEDQLRIARGPNTDVITFGGYYINNYLFYSTKEDDKIRVQNSGVTLQAEGVHFSNSKDKNPITTSISYFRIIQEIWEIDYITFRVPVFKCKWLDSKSGVVVEDLRFTLVDLNKMSYTDEPFIMASQARQIFYVTDLVNHKWSMVLEGRAMHTTDDEDSLDILETSSFSSRTIENKVDDVPDEIHATRCDHNEGMWEK
ncbi:hypothetical protein V8G54_029497 [Vigna mungo]|uniref:Transposase n=1 Tax=Vigna mungo TaxID=3915 RepID=A0AAQ3RKD5_VIGMU